MLRCAKPPLARIFLPPHKLRRAPETTLEWPGANRLAQCAGSQEPLFGELPPRRAFPADPQPMPDLPLTPPPADHPAAVVCAEWRGPPAPSIRIPRAHLDRQKESKEYEVRQPPLDCQCQKADFGFGWPPGPAAPLLSVSAHADNRWPGCRE